MVSDRPYFLFVSGYLDNIVIGKNKQKIGSIMDANDIIRPPTMKNAMIKIKI